MQCEVTRLRVKHHGNVGLPPSASCRLAIIHHPIAVGRPPSRLQSSVFQQSAVPSSSSPAVQSSSSPVVQLSSSRPASEQPVVGRSPPVYRSDIGRPWRRPAHLAPITAGACGPPPTGRPPVVTAERVDLSTDGLDSNHRHPGPAPTHQTHGYRIGVPMPRESEWLSTLIDNSVAFVRCCFQNASEARM